MPVPLTFTTAPLTKFVPVSVSCTFVPIRPLLVLRDVSVGDPDEVELTSGLEVAVALGLASEATSWLDEPPHDVQIRVAMAINAKSLTTRAGIEHRASRI